MSCCLLKSRQGNSVRELLYTACTSRSVTPHLSLVPASCTYTCSTRALIHQLSAPTLLPRCIIPFAQAVLDALYSNCTASPTAENTCSIIITHQSSVHFYDTLSSIEHVLKHYTTDEIAQRYSSPISSFEEDDEMEDTTTSEPTEPRGYVRWCSWPVKLWFCCALLTKLFTLSNVTLELEKSIIHYPSTDGSTTIPCSLYHLLAVLSFEPMRPSLHNHQLKRTDELPFHNSVCELVDPFVIEFTKRPLLPGYVVPSYTALTPQQYHCFLYLATSHILTHTSKSLYDTPYYFGALKLMVRCMLHRTTSSDTHPRLYSLQPAAMTNDAVLYLRTTSGMAFKRYWDIFDGKYTAMQSMHVGADCILRRYLTWSLHISDGDIQQQVKLPQTPPLISHPIKYQSLSVVKDMLVRSFDVSCYHRLIQWLQQPGEPQDNCCACFLIPQFASTVAQHLLAEAFFADGQIFCEDIIDYTTHERSTCCLLVIRAAPHDAFTMLRRFSYFSSDHLTLKHAIDATTEDESPYVSFVYLLLTLVDACNGHTAVAIKTVYDSLHLPTTSFNIQKEYETTMLSAVSTPAMQTLINQDFPTLTHRFLLAKLLFIRQPLLIHKLHFKMLQAKWTRQQYDYIKEKFKHFPSNTSVKFFNSTRSSPSHTTSKPYIFVPPTSSLDEALVDTDCVLLPSAFTDEILTFVTTFDRNSDVERRLVLEFLQFLVPVVHPTTSIRSDVLNYIISHSLVELSEPKQAVLFSHEQHIHEALQMFIFARDDNIPALSLNHQHKHQWFVDLFLYPVTISGPEQTSLDASKITCLYSSARHTFDSILPPVNIKLPTHSHNGSAVSVLLASVINCDLRNSHVQAETVSIAKDQFVATLRSQQYADDQSPAFANDPSHYHTNTTVSSPFPLPSPTHTPSVASVDSQRSPNQAFAVVTPYGTLNLDLGLHVDDADSDS